MAKWKVDIDGQNHEIVIKFSIAGGGDLIVDGRIIKSFPPSARGMKEEMI